MKEYKVFFRNGEKYVSDNFFVLGEVKDGKFLYVHYNPIGRITTCEKDFEKVIIVEKDGKKYLIKDTTSNDGLVGLLVENGGKLLILKKKD